ncbi:MAG: hypothetical protein ACE5IR_11655 [bacterium]
MKNNLLYKLKKLLTRKSRPETRLLEQRYVDLYTTYEKIKLNEEKISGFTKITSQIEDLFQSEKDWDKSNQIEQFLIPLYEEAQLDVEIKVKVLDAKRKLREDLWRFYYAEFERLKRDDAKQSLLSNLNKDLHWAYDIEALGKDYVTKTRIRTSLFFIASILMFFMVDQLEFIAKILNITKGEKGDFLVTAMASGWMGTSFSMLIGLKNRIQISSISDLKVIHRFDYILSRALIGMISGLLLFYAFQSSILTGTFFPVFSSQNALPLLDEKNFSLLIFWCFVSGFSEKLVPDLLTKTGKTVDVE